MAFSLRHSACLKQTLRAQVRTRFDLGLYWLTVSLHSSVFADEGAATAPAISGLQTGEHLQLPVFIVELDQRFITEMARTAAWFTELFHQSGRPKLVQVPIPCPSLHMLWACTVRVRMTSLVP